MPIFSRNDKITKIMDNAGNVIVDLNDLTKTSIIQRDNTRPIYFNADSSGKLIDYTIHGNDGSVSYPYGVGCETNLFNNLGNTIYARYLSRDDYGKVVESTGQYANARSIIFSAPEPGDYIFSCKNEDGTTVDRMRIGIFDEAAAIDAYARVTNYTMTTVDGYSYSKFTVPVGAKVIMAYLWSGSGSTAGYDDSVIEELLLTQEFQLIKGTELQEYTPHVIDRVHLTITGKNMYSKKLSPVVNGFGTVSNYKWYTYNSVWSVIIPCLPNTAYTLSKGLSNRFRIMTFNDYPVLNSIGIRYFSGDTVTNMTFTTTEQENYIALCIYFGDNFSADILDTIQLEVGNEVTEHEDYQQYDISIPIDNYNGLSRVEYVNQTSGVEIPYFAGTNEFKIYSRTPSASVKLSGKIEWRDDLD